MERLLAELPPDTSPKDCQRVVIVGLGGIGKTQIALEAMYCICDQDPDCNLFWVPAAKHRSLSKRKTRPRPEGHNNVATDSSATDSQLLCFLIWQVAFFPTFRPPPPVIVSHHLLRRHVGSDLRKG
ncbi:hypothetical protein B0T25DRAFT_265507 [Lasiosphaeria hispida]|uniref:NB-ARC domain-containing protein n=1 Tax=Lasiosphaeria hispida TaxID=260671 RepID=A0AAJ0MA97_9PEZI|nr:hypothetical protein B0T25DRAFT_265507 [Lasiosphaeria hispida]